MKKLIFILSALLFLAGTTDVQAQWGKKLLKKAGESAKKATEKNVERKIEKAVDKAFDGAEDAVTGKGNDNNNEQQTSTQGNAANIDNTNGGETVTQQQKAEPLEMTYAKSDFVPGDEIFFEDNLIGEKLGEFPSQWDMETGNAEIASLAGELAINMIGYTILTPLIEPSKNYLPDEFTIEWDIYAMPGEIEIGMNDSRTFIGRFYIGKENGSLNASWAKPDGSSGSISTQKVVETNKWHHVSLSFNKRALKMYVDGIRYVNVPNMKKPTSIWFWTREGGFYKNVRIAKGAVPLYDRMMSDGKFITYGITFDVGKSTIKPESMGEINRIVTLMKENPDLKFSVEGHTDSTGNEASNQTLSEARSNAIVDKLVELGISADRLSASGKGQTSPIADNGTDEGRAKNRRVEFVKI